MQNGLLSEVDLSEMGIADPEEVAIIMRAVSELPKPTPSFKLPSNSSENNNGTTMAVQQWLDSIKLGEYAETFRKHMYTDMERVSFPLF